MRAFSTATGNYLSSVAAKDARSLLWIVAKNRDTGAPESIGFWNGDDHRTFTIGGQARTYYGAGALIAIPSITYQVGLVVRMQSVSVSAIAPEIQTALRGYEPRLAAVEIHRALFDPDSGALVDEPHRMFKGEINTVTFSVSATGEVGCEIELASQARSLTRTLTALRSDNALRGRHPGDRFFRYADVSGSVDVFWGEKRAGRKATGSGGGTSPAPRPGRGNGEWGG